MNTQLLVDRYELGERVGVGGMSTVVLAFDRRLERHVAVKLLAEHLADDVSFVSRFRREALSAARLVHPNIVQVFDFGLDEATDRHYIVMEYVRGQSAAQILRDRKSLSIADALPLLDGACRALHYAHRNGVVHRDVKPGNILRSEDGQVKLADFGIAKAGDSSAITQAGSVLGTAAYLAPEQAHGEEASPRSDIYGVGVVAYQLLSGRLPYEATSLTELALMQQRERPPALSSLNPAVPAALDEQVMRALAIDPAERPATAEELREALVAGAQGIGGATGRYKTEDATAVLGAERTAATRAQPRRLEPHAPRAGAGAAAAGTGLQQPPRQAPVRRQAPPRDRGRGRRAATWGLIAAVVVGVAIAALLASSGGEEREPVRTVEITGSDTAEVRGQLEELIDSNTR